MTKTAMGTSEQPSGRPLAIVLVASGLIGFGLGLSNATWQVTVETGQVLAGLVQYPRENPFYIYHLKAFTIINHISAILLRTGLSEQTASILISGLLGAISFTAIASLIFAISRCIGLSILGTLLVYLANLVGDGTVYPILLMGQPPTYGILGTSFAVLVVGLIGSRAYRAGLFCLPVALSVHPSIGLWIASIGLICAASDWSFAKRILRRCYPYLIAGILLTTLAAAWQIYLMRGVPDTDPRIQQQYLSAFVQHWDSHRRPLYECEPGHGILVPWGVIYCAYSIMTGFCGRRLFEDNKAAVFLFRVAIWSGAISLLLGILTHLPPQSIPTSLLILMPGRYVNLNNIMLAPLVFGILISPRFRPYMTNLRMFVLLMVGALLSRHDEAQFIVFGTTLIWIMHVALSSKSPAERPAIGERTRRIGYALAASVALCGVLAVNLPREKYVNRFLRHPDPMRDRTNNPFYATVAERPGLLTITHFSPLIQLRTRRPILADMASPNFFTYAPETAPMFDRILRQVYGVNLLQPPPENLKHEEIRPELYRRLWEERPPSQWKNIRRTFGTTDVLTPADWVLQLPVVTQDYHFALYAIPAD